MNKFKSVVVAAAMMFAMSSVFAGGNSNNNDVITNNNQTYNQPGANATGNGYGGDASSIAGAASVAEAKANAAAIAAQAQKQQQGQAQGQQQGQVANGGKATGGAANGVVNTSLNVSGNNYEAAASSVFLAPIPAVATSCRLYAVGGGTTKDGAASGSIPLGNDQTCLSGNNVNGMIRTNQMFPGTYSVDDIVREQCKVEGMSDADACKKLK